MLCYADEIKAFVGINILMGLHVLPDLDSYWSLDDRLRVDGIAKVMPKHRFKKLNQYLHIADNTQMPAYGEPGHDPYYKVSPLLNMLSRTFHQRYRPHCELAVDEAMVPFKGRHHLKQYVPSKPTKWGFKVWTLADSTNGYVKFTAIEFIAMNFSRNSYDVCMKYISWVIWNKKIWQ